MSGGSIHIPQGQTASLQQLQTLSESMKDGQVLRAMQHADGSTTLYVRGRFEALSERFHPERREASQKLAQDIVRQALDAAVQQPLSNKKAVQDAANYPQHQAKLKLDVGLIQQRLPGAANLQGALFKNILDQAVTVRASAERQARLEGKDPDAVALLRAFEGGQPQRDTALADRLGDAQGAVLKQMSLDGQANLLMSDGVGFKNSVLRIAAAQIGPLTQGGLPKDYASATPEQRQFLDRLHQRAIGHLDHVVNGTMVDAQDARGRVRHDHEGNALQVPQQVVVGGKAYDVQHFLTQGGYGAVTLYRAADGDQIVLKTGLPGDKSVAALHAEGKKEVEMHLRAQGPGHANVVGFKGVLPLPNGTLGIAVSMAPLGNVNDFIKTLMAMKANMDPADFDLVAATVSKEMLEGVAHAQRESGEILHLDVKPPNFLIDGGGVIQLADFGASEKGKSLFVGDVAAADNPAWTAPELLHTAQGRREARNYQSVLQQNDKKALDAYLGQLSPQQAQQAMKDPADPYLARQSADLWSLGASIFQVLTGEPPFVGLGVYQDSIASGKAVDKALLPARLPPGQAPLPADAQDLINGLGHPDPNLRTPIAVALQNPWLNRPEVGGARAHQLIQQVATGTYVPPPPVVVAAPS